MALPRYFLLGRAELIRVTYPNGSIGGKDSADLLLEVFIERIDINWARTPVAACDTEIGIGLITGNAVSPHYGLLSAGLGIDLRRAIGIEKQQIIRSDRGFAATLPARLNWQFGFILPFDDLATRVDSEWTVAERLHSLQIVTEGCRAIDLGCSLICRLGGPFESRLVKLLEAPASN